MTAAAALLTARDDGFLGAQAAVQLPFMAPRLQGDFWADGRLDLSLWAAGRLARITLTPLAGPHVLSPNGVRCAAGGFAVAQSAPALVVRGARALAVHPARRAAWWHRPTGLETDVVRRRADGVRFWHLGWGVLALDQRGADLVIAAGEDEAECRAGLALSVHRILAEAEAYAAACDRLPEADPVLRSMVMQGTHAALSAIRRDAAGGFAGLAAGQAYSAPARTYFRDGHWTLQALLTLAPGAVRDQIRLLAEGVHPDGQAPSGVIVSGAAQARAWDRFRLSEFPYKEEHLHPQDWWSDHFDSPLFFVLTLGDYVRATGDRAELARHAGKVAAIFRRYVGLCAGTALPKKPRNDRDWADNVYREGDVAYDLGLWVGALDVIAACGGELGSALAQEAGALATSARAALARSFGGTHVPEYANTDGWTEPRLAADSLTLLRWDGLPNDQAVLTLRAMQAQLETRANPAQPYGDWGVMCGFPLYARPSDTRAKSAFAWRYHNGSEWPYLTALYAEERLRRGLGGARYALTRWWEICLQKGWAGAVEYHSPPFGRGSLLQGWSGLPAHVAVTYRDLVLAELR